MKNKNLKVAEKLKQLTTALMSFLSKIQPDFIQDIKKYAPKIWVEIDKFRQEKILVHFGDVIEEGKRKGIIRKDCNSKLLMLIYLNTIQNMINPQVLSELPFSALEIFDTLVKIVFEGVFTDKGRADFAKLKPIKEEV